MAQARAHPPQLGWLEALMAHFEGARRVHGAPQTTVEALMFAMRSGAKVLSESSNQRRLKEGNSPIPLRRPQRAARLKSDEWPGLASLSCFAGT